MSLIHTLKHYLPATRSVLTNTCLLRVCRAYSTEETTNVGGYAKAFEKFEELKEQPKEKPATFASLLRNSKFIDVR